MNIIKGVSERFLSYVKFDTTSNEESSTVPSTPNQKLFAAFLVDELKKIGLDDAQMDGYGYVYAHLPATKGYEDRDKIGFISHMDTSPAVSGADIRPARVQYTGGDIRLSHGIIKAADFPILSRYVGEELITTDGTTLLGADDKAGVSEIITAMEYLLSHPEIPHGRIAIGFTPDEEIGCGAEHFNLAVFDAKYAYTVDGGTLGELEYENFNAASAKFTVNGVNIHPGSAKNKMKNAVLVATELIGMFPPSETPAHTEGYEGFYHVCDIKGNETKTEIAMIIRDHDREKFEKRKTVATDIVSYLNRKYGENTVVADICDSYYNMKEKILSAMYVVERAENAMREVGVNPVAVPIRGGTDGARLSFMGLPCPNLATGGENFHGVHEFVSVPAMEKTVEILVAISKEA